MGNGVRMSGKESAYCTIDGIMTASCTSLVASRNRLAKQADSINSEIGAGDKGPPSTATNASSSFATSFGGNSVSGEVGADSSLSRELEAESSVALEEKVVDVVE